MLRQLLPLLLVCTFLAAQPPKGWRSGRGYGWVYGPQDEVGARRAVTKPDKVLAALRAVKTGKVFDLGVPVDRRSYKWPGHSPTEVMSYRSPEGVKRGGDAAANAATVSTPSPREMDCRQNRSRDSAARSEASAEWLRARAPSPS